MLCGNMIHRFVAVLNRYENVTNINPALRDSTQSQQLEHAMHAIPLSDRSAAHAAHMGGRTRVSQLTCAQLDESITWLFYHPHACGHLRYDQSSSSRCRTPYLPRLRPQRKRSTDNQIGFSLWYTTCRYETKGMTWNNDSRVQCIWVCFDSLVRAARFISLRNRKIGDHLYKLCRLKLPWCIGPSP